MMLHVHKCAAVVGTCGVCGAERAHTRFDSQLSSGGGDCRRQARTGGELVCDECTPFVKLAEIQARAWITAGAVLSGKGFRRRVAQFDRLRAAQLQHPPNE